MGGSCQRLRPLTDEGGGTFQLQAVPGQRWQTCPSSGLRPPSPMGEGFIMSNALRDSAQGVAFSPAIRYNVFCINVQRGMSHVR